MGKRITRTERISDAEAERLDKIRRQVAAELPEIHKRAKAAKARIRAKKR